MGRDEVIDETQWQVLPYDVRRELSQALVKKAVPEMMKAVEQEPHIVLADKADNIANAEAALAYTMKWMYAAVAGVCLGIFFTVAGSVMARITGEYWLCAIGALMTVAFFVVGVVWQYNQDPAGQHKEIVKAKAEYARTQRRLPE